MSKLRHKEVEFLSKFTQISYGRAEIQTQACWLIIVSIYFYTNVMYNENYVRILIAHGLRK